MLNSHFIACYLLLRIVFLEAGRRQFQDLAIWPVLLEVRTPIDLLKLPWLPWDFSYPGKLWGSPAHLCPTDSCSDILIRSNMLKFQVARYPPFMTGVGSRLTYRISMCLYIMLYHSIFTSLSPSLSLSLALSLFVYLHQSYLFWSDLILRICVSTLLHIYAPNIRTHMYHTGML